MLDVRKYIDAVHAKTPLVHFITNYVTVRDVANMTIASGSSPIMSDDVIDAAQITRVADSLVINIGTLNERTIDGMFAAGREARKLDHIRIFDPVGAGAAELRTETSLRLIDEVGFHVVRGNVSEIKALALGSADTKGVDASVADVVTDENLGELLAFMKEYARSLGCVVAATGAIDLVTDGEHSFAIREGHPMMGRITGSGCMLTGIIGAFTAAAPDVVLEATAAAIAFYGRAGSRAAAKSEELGHGSASFANYLIDEVDLMAADFFDAEVLVDEY